MPLPEALEEKDPCDISARWILHLRVAAYLLLLARILSADPRIIALQKGVKLLLVLISGYRTADEQEALAAAGRPAADPSRSTHLSCPATGADIRIEGHMDPFSNAESKQVWLIVGQTAESIGLRWGGGSPRDSDGFPVDFNHFDLGPRK